MNHASISSVQRNGAGYPPLLREIPDAPKTLFYRGALPPTGTPPIAIVGTRKASRDGLALAERLGEAFARRGFAVISGLAFGIDAAAHRGALAGGGPTFAVLGCGADAIYPTAHERLGEEILATGGGILSEYSAGTPALPHQFLARNRIVSGLSLAVVVVEAPLRSGSLVTAKHALDQGREVLVVPGPASHRNYAGSHMLIRNGARLATCAEDVLEDLGMAESSSAECVVGRQRELPADPAMRTLYAALAAAPEPLSVDNLAATTTLEPHIVQQSLALLMFEGIAEEKNGRWTIR